MWIIADHPILQLALRHPTAPGTNARPLDTVLSERPSVAEAIAQSRHSRSVQWFIERPPKPGWTLTRTGTRAAIRFCGVKRRFSMRDQIQPAHHVLEDVFAHPVGRRPRCTQRPLPLLAAPRTARSGPAPRLTRQDRTGRRGPPLSSRLSFRGSEGTSNRSQDRREWSGDFRRRTLLSLGSVARLLRPAAASWDFLAGRMH